MPFKRTDKGKINWPKGISKKDKAFCRKFYKAIDKYWERNVVCLDSSNTVIACSAGLDSCVLAHVYAQAKVLKDINGPTKMVYVNHGLRFDSETKKDESHVRDFAKCLDFNSESIKVHVDLNGNVQALAREARYDALADCKTNDEVPHTVLLAHHANDVAESILFQTITGREVVGISSELHWKSTSGKKTLFIRPLLGFTREDIRRYATIWGLDWVEDSSNQCTKYSRNKIRHDLIPWIEENMNPGIVKMLAKL